MDRPDPEQQAAAARQLLAGRFHCVLSTNTADRPGQPFGSVVPYCLDWHGLPLFLLSHLAQHTKNLVADPRTSLTVLGAFEGDVQQAARLTGVGEIRPLEDGAAELAGRYFRYFPQSRMYYESLGFRFFGFHPERWHFNSGFATARWFGNERLIRPNPLYGGPDAAPVATLDARLGAALRGYLGNQGIGVDGQPETRVCGVDGEGMDVGIGERLMRIPFPRAVDSLPSLAAMLEEMGLR